MPRSLRVLNVVAALLPLGSGLATLGSNLFVPTYPYRDSLLLVAAYCAFYLWVIHAFWRDTPAAPRLAVAKALGAFAFLATASRIGPLWMSFTPGRYVYQLFDWGPGAKVGLLAFIYLGRGVWNTINVFACNRDWWFSLRARQPLLGRVLTAVPIGITVFCVQRFMALTRLEAQTFSSEAQEIARLVSDTVTCEDVRAKAGTTSSDVRRRGEREYRVTIRWGCAQTNVLVRDPDDRVGVVSGPRTECCAPGASPPAVPTAPAAPPA
jgi:hypothetical protein